MTGTVIGADDVSSQDVVRVRKRRRRGESEDWEEEEERCIQKGKPRML